MDMREIAQQLIQNVEGIDSEKNIDGVIQIFEGIKTGMNNIWEDHLYTNCNDVLFYSKTKCPNCNSSIEVTRDRSTVTVKGV